MEVHKASDGPQINQSNSEFQPKSMNDEFRVSSVQFIKSQLERASSLHFQTQCSIIIIALH